MGGTLATRICDRVERPMPLTLKNTKKIFQGLNTSTYVILMLFLAFSHDQVYRLWLPMGIVLLCL